MAFLQIRKKYNNVWLHISNNGEFMISEFYFKIDDNGFQIVERGGARRFVYSLSEITVYDDINGGSAETFTTAVALYHRLVELEYTGVADGSGGGGGGTLTLEQARQNGDTINGNIKVSFELENKQSTNLAQVVDVTGKTVSFSDSDTLTANFSVNYFENDSVYIETFTLPVVIGNEDKFIYFVNKSDELCTLTSDGINEIWYREELLSIQIQPKGSIVLKNNGSYWVVLSLFQSLEEAREINNIVKGRIIGESVFASKTSEDFAQIGDVNTAVSTKAPINNPTFTGSVKVPNAALSNEAVALGQLDDFEQSTRFDLLFNTPTMAGVTSTALNGGTIINQSDSIASDLRNNRPSGIIEAWNIRGNASNTDSGGAINILSQNPLYNGSSSLFVFNACKLTNQIIRIGFSGNGAQSPATPVTNNGVFIEINDGVLTYSSNYIGLTTTAVNSLTLTDVNKWYFLHFEVVTGGIRCKIRESSVSGTLVYNELITTNLPISGGAIWVQLRMTIGAVSKIASSDYLLQIGRVSISPKKPNFLRDF